MKVYIERNNTQVKLIRFRKILTLLTLETLKWMLSGPTCLRLESQTYACSMVTTLNYTLIVFFVFVFKCLRSSHYVSRVCHKDIVQIGEICTFMNVGNFEVDTFASDVFMSKLGSLLSVTCRDMFCACSSHGKSFQRVPV